MNSPPWSDITRLWAELSHLPLPPTYLYSTSHYTYPSMEGLSEGGGEGVEESDRATQIIKGDPPGLIIQIYPDSVTGEIGG